MPAIMYRALTCVDLIGRSAPETLDDLPAASEHAPATSFCCFFSERFFSDFEDFSAVQDSRDWEVISEQPLNANRIITDQIDQ